MWQRKVGGTSHFNQVGTIRWREGEMRERKRKKNREKKRKKKKIGVRSSTFSLGFTEIGPLVFIGARDKIYLRDESSMWVQESGVFAKLHGNFWACFRAARN